MTVEITNTRGILEGERVSDPDLGSECICRCRSRHNRDSLRLGVGRKGMYDDVVLGKKTGGSVAAECGEWEHWIGLIGLIGTREGMNRR